MRRPRCRPTASCNGRPARRWPPRRTMRQPSKTMRADRRPTLFGPLRTFLLGVAATGTLFSQGPTDSLAATRALLDSGKVQEGETAIRVYLASHPSSADAHFLLGYALFREQKAQASLDEFTAGAKFRRPGSVELKIVAADYVMLNDLSDADKWFSQVVRESPNDADAWYLLGRTKYNENEFAAAIAALEHALTLHPKLVEAENNIGLAWKELNDKDKARSAFATAIAWQGDAPLDAQPFLNLGTLCAESQENEKALPLLLRAQSLAPGNPSVHEELGKVYLAMNRLAEAQAELERAVALSPETSSLHYKLGQVLRKEGQSARAQEEFAICERLNGAHSSSKTPNPPAGNPRDPQ
ncbi:tetratricopeptide repeat protein [Acidobacteria bacterium AB60]|nr:tetratricopeptide repeat protein [Acidobacteria bacterium AB60]